MTKIQIGAVRFYNKTWIENVQWKQKNKYIGCIYGMDKEIPARVPYGSKIYVIEMNNSINKIMGIGVIYNIYRTQNRRKIYENDNYNRYVYKGHKHKSRKELLEINEEIVLFLENMLFKGSRHFKRGHGVSIIPIERFGVIYKEKKRKKTQCGKCGQLGHNARGCKSKVRVRCKDIKSSEKKCKFCGKLDKGHICPRFDIDKKRIKQIILFFYNLF